MVANMATRPCLISVSRRLGDRQAVTRCHKKSKLSWSACRLATGHVFCIALVALLHHMSHEYLASHQASWRLRHPYLQKDQGGPKSRGVLGHPQALRSLGGVMHSTQYCVLTCLKRSCAQFSYNFATPHSTEDGSMQGRCEYQVVSHQEWKNQNTATQAAAVLWLLPLWQSVVARALHTAAQRRVRVVGPVTPGGSSQAILAVFEKSNLLVSGRGYIFCPATCVVGAS